MLMDWAPEGDVSAGKHHILTGSTVRKQLSLRKFKSGILKKDSLAIKIFDAPGRQVVVEQLIGLPNRYLASARSRAIGIDKSVTLRLSQMRVSTMNFYSATVHERRI